MIIKTPNEDIDENQSRLCRETRDSAEVGLKRGISDHTIVFSADKDIGRKRETNQDEIICFPEYGFFAVSDGIGGLARGGKTSEIIAKNIPFLIERAYHSLKDDKDPSNAARVLFEEIRLFSDDISKALNSGTDPTYGATLCGVWFVGDHAVFVNMGDSRAYLLKYRKKKLLQITVDHNLATVFATTGQLSSAAASLHPSGRLLTRYVGMFSPAIPETFIEKVDAGDRILICSDGLYGMLSDELIPGILRCSDRADRVMERLISEANISGGKDNISAIYIKVTS
jgi:serine/threonine protein phosphatase PrpC